ncbi:MAG: hypothetical protein E2578_03660 [Comamonas sp.]|nr:hypothetical protein [Comamonas sp.]
MTQSSQELSLHGSRCDSNAVREGGDNRLRSGNYPAEAKGTEPEKTRQQVIDELIKETPSQRDARNQAIAG